jgi:hypothetical protein
MRSGLLITAYYEGESESLTLCDGYLVSVQMTAMGGGDDVVVVQVRQGMAPAAAVSLLRRIADLIDREGSELLNLSPKGMNCANLREDGTLDWGDDTILPGREPE